MSSDDQDLLAKINQLTGKINRAKNEPPTIHHTPYHPALRSQSYSNNSAFNHNHVATSPHSGPAVPTTVYSASRGGFSTRSRGYSRGGRGAKVHRNHTLVLNGHGSTQINPNNSESKNETSASAFVAKTGRHLQLINAKVYDRHTQTRVEVLAEARKKKLQQRNEREKNKFIKHLQRHTEKAGVIHEVTVQGIRFQVAKGGSKLVKVPGEDSRSKNSQRFSGVEGGSSSVGDVNAAKATPKTTILGGVMFHRSKNGNMYRAGIIKAHRYGFYKPRRTFHDRTKFWAFRARGIVKKINEPCKVFSTTGSCSKGPRCRYVHDPIKVAICKDFILTGSCPSGDSCDLSHELTPERMPTCMHFAKGNCSKENCRYAHVRLSPAALVCRQFGFYGFCEKGISCAERHVYECPDFSNTGSCTIKGCKLPHRYKASVMRTATTLGEPLTGEENSDISSDEDDDEIDSEDVDSDDLDGEFMGDGETDTEIPTQQDFVYLSNNK